MTEEFKPGQQQQTRLQERHHELLSQAAPKQKLVTFTPDLEH